MKSIINRFVSLYKKKSVKNGMWLYALQLFNTVVPLLTLPYITRILGASQYGVFSIALNIIGYYQVVVEYGFIMSATRKIALSEDKRIINKTFTAVLYSRFLLFFACIIVTILLGITGKYSKDQIGCMYVLLIVLIGNCIQLNWLFQGLQQMKFISIASIISRTLSVALTFVFVKSPDDLLLYCVLYAISPLLNGIIGITIAYRKYQLKLIRIRFEDVLKELQSGWYVFTTQLSSKVFGAIGITILGLFATTTEVGIYSAIQKIPNIMILAWSPISQVLYPISSKKMKESVLEGIKFVRKIQHVVIIISIIIAITISVFSKIVVQIAFGSEYANYYYWVIPLLCWLVVAINNNFMGIQVLLAGGFDKQYSKCFQIGILCTVVFNFVLIYLFSGNGACCAPALSEIVLGVLLYIENKKIEKRITE